MSVESSSLSSLVAIVGILSMCIIGRNKSTGANSMGGDLRIVEIPCELRKIILRSSSVLSHGLLNISSDFLGNLVGLLLIFRGCLSLCVQRNELLLSSEVHSRFQLIVASCGSVTMVARSTRSMRSSRFVTGIALPIKLVVLTSL